MIDAFIRYGRPRRYALVPPFCELTMLGVERWLLGFHVWKQAGLTARVRVAGRLLMVRARFSRVRVARGGAA